jgi:hypothetical protein
MAFTLRQNDSGVFLELRFVENGNPVSIATATKREFVLVDPRGRTKIRSGELVNQGSDGLLQYLVQVGDFDTPGRWRCFGHLVYPVPGQIDADLYSAEIPVDVAQTFGRSA